MFGRSLSSSSGSSDDEGPHRKKQRSQPPKLAYKMAQKAGKSEHLTDSDNSGDEAARPVMGGLTAADFMSDMANSKSDTDASTVPDVAKNFLIEKPTKPLYNTFAEKMMAKMGYEKGKGLGKHGQGRVEIVGASKQRGRRGLGLTLRGFEPSDVLWDYEKEVVSAEEQLEWIDPCQEDIPTLDTLRAWVKEGPKSHKLEDDYEFCDEQVVQTVLKSKSVFDELECEEMRRARTKSNPYETIRGVFFQNRAAMKMANMDAVFDFMFTNPVDEHGSSLLAPGELLYFADVCAGPGGFSEYVLWRKKWDAKAFGFTLKGPNDFKLEEFFAASSELFEPFYGVGGLEGDGDVYKPENLREFRQFVLNSTDGKGVHFVMADGGFDVDGRENLQEWLSKRLYLCECTAALSILRTGGHFVCKLFDIFLPYSVGLVYLMYRAFQQVSIFKPVTSRPANSERYIVCKGLRPGAERIHDYMFEVNLMFEANGATSTEDINEVVPMDVILADEQFVNYIITSNETLGIKQSISLAKIKAFAQNSALYETRQSEMREECLKLWKIPDQVRTAPDKSMNTHKKFMTLLKADDLACFSTSPKQLTASTLDAVKNIYDYRCFLTTSEKRCYLLGLGKSYVFRWDGQPKSRWQKVDDVKLELPMDTLIEAENVQEFRGEGKGQRRIMAIHAIDAMVLGGVDIRDLHFCERLEKLRKFLKAITRPTRSDLAPIRVKEVHRCEELESVFDRLELKVVKGSGGQPRLSYNAENGGNFLPVGVMFVKTVKEPWMMAFSNSQGRKYFFNSLSQKSVFETPKDAVAPFKSCQSHRCLWSWDDGVRIHQSQRNEDPAKVSKEKMIEFIAKKLGKVR